MVWYPCGGQSANRLAFPSGRTFGIISQRSRARMGSQGHLRWNDAIHGYSSLRANHDHDLPANRALASGTDLWKVT